MNFRALGDHVIILRDPVKDTSEGGLALPPAKNPHKGLEYGEVIAAGKDASAMLVGVRVLFTAKKAMPITNPEKQDLVVLREEDIVARVVD